MQKLLAFPLAVAATLALAGPALAFDDDESAGIDLSVGAQAIGGAGLVGTVDFKADMIFADLGLSLRMSPNLTSFFYGDGHLAFNGRLGQYVPLLRGLESVLGVGAAMAMRDVPTTVQKSGSDVGVYVFMPIGLRYRLPVAGLAAEAVYHLPAFSLWESKEDLSRWRFALSGQAASLAWGAYYEVGPVFNGPGARIGWRF
ncbi:MAG: hypothetical protein ACLGIN_00585 [Candidatus Sericytochromatia bacterium]